MWKREEKEQLELQNLRTDHVMIRSQLKYLIEAKVVGTAELEPRASSNLAEKTPGLGPVWVTTPPRHSGSGYWPGLEPNRTKPLVKTRTHC